MKKKRNKKLRKKLTQKLLKELLHYNPDTGIFTWRVNVGTRGKAGSVAGCAWEQNGARYFFIGFFGKKYKAHRLAWLYMTGEWPKDQIDHIDGDGLNNRWKNLREATSRVNGMNQKRCSTNTSGQTGVSWSEQRNKWESCIKINGRNIRLGRYDDFHEAVLIRIQAQEYYGFHENHGRV